MLRMERIVKKISLRPGLSVSSLESRLTITIIIDFMSEMKYYFYNIWKMTTITNASLPTVIYLYQENFIVIIPCTFCALFFIYIVIQAFHRQTTFR